jgi:mucin-19
MWRSGVSTFSDRITGIISTATKLENPRIFEITGDVAASPILFDGTGNVSFAATIQPNSVELGVDTFGDYVESISGKIGEIVVTGGTGEGSTPVISFDPNPTIGGNVIIGNNLQVNNNLNVDGNITIGGTSATLNTETLTVTDAQILLGVTTSSNLSDISTDLTANTGGIAIASTEGTPLVNLTVVGIDTLPATYKRFVWVSAGTFAGLGTDAWLSNYAIGIGSTQFPAGTRLAVGSVQFTENDLAVVRNINSSGVSTLGVTSTTNLTSQQLNVSGITTLGITSTTNLTTRQLNVSGILTASRIVGTSLSISGISTIANFLMTPVGTGATVGGIGVTYYGDGSQLTKISSSSGYADTAGIATNVIGGIASVTSLNVTGITTLASIVGTSLSISGISTLGVTSTTNLTSQQLNVSGITTLGITSISQLNVSGITTLASIVGTSLSISGISTLGVTSTTNLTSQQLNVSGITTLGVTSTTNLTTQQLLVTGITTLVSIVGTSLSISGISTIANFLMTPVGTGATVGGIGVTYYGDGSQLTKISSSSGYADTAGIATNVIGGIASVSQLNVSGITTLASIVGTSLSISGISTLGITSTTNLTSQQLNVSGITTLGVTTITQLYVSGVSTFSDRITGIISTATKLENQKTFEITGDVVASPIFFDGTGNVSLAATIQPNSVGLGTDTFGDYVKDITGTANQIIVTGGTGEGSSPIISFAPNPTIGGNVTIGNDLQVNNNLNVTGNITVGGTQGYLLVENLRVSDKDIVLGFTTDSNNNDASTDTTANHGGIAIASTEGNPLVTLTNPGIGETLPATYKKFMWFKAGSFGIGTDAWLSNYAIGIGSTQFPTGTRLAAGSVQFTENDLAVVRNINASGIITATEFKGTLTGYASSAGIATNLNGGPGVVYQYNTGITSFVPNGDDTQVLLFNGSTSTPYWGYVGSAGGTVGYADRAGIATYADNSGIATNLKGGLTGNIPYQLNPDTTTFVDNSSATPTQVLRWNGSAPYWGSVDAGSITGVATYADRAGIATYADRAGIATNVIGGIASVSQLNVIGITTLGVTSTTDLTSQQLNITGITTLTSIVGTSLSITGISTIANFIMTPVGAGATVGGIGVVTYYGDGSGLININLSSVVGVVTYAERSGIATYADRAGIATNVIGGIASVTSLDVSGITTLGTVEISSGIITAKTGIVTYYGDGSGLTNINLSSVVGVVTYAERSGIATYADRAGIATYADYAGISTNVIGGIASVSQLNVTGITTLTSIVGTSLSITGISTIANFIMTPVGAGATVGGIGVVTYYGDGSGLTNINLSSVVGVVTYAERAGIATYADNAGIATNVIGGIASVTSLDVSGITILGTVEISSGIITATTGVVTYYGDGFNLTNVVSASGYADTSGIATNVIGGIASVTSLNVTGITTLASIVGTSLSITGISTIANFIITNVGTGATVGGVGVLTYYGDGSQLTGLIAGVSISTNTADQSQLIPYVTGTGSTTGFGVTTLFTYNPFSGNLGIGTTTPTSKLTVIGDVLVSGVLTAHRLYGDDIVGTSLSITGISTLGTVEISSGIITSTTGIVTYYGDGSKLENVVSASGYADNAGIATNVIGGIASVTSLNVTGISTLGTVEISSGIITATTGIVTYYGDGSGLTNINLSAIVGVVTYVDKAGIATYADYAGIATNVIGGIASVTSLDVSGISTLGITSTTDLTTQQLNVTGITTLGITTISQLYVSGVSTFVGVGTFSGDLYVGGDLYVTDDLVFDEFTARNANITGITTLNVGIVSSLTVSGVTTLGITSTTDLTTQQLNVTGVTTLTSIVGTSLSITGISTIANFIMTPVGTGATVGGIGVTYYGDGSQLINISSSSIVGIITYADRSGIATNVIGGIASVTSLDVSGISTLGITSTTDLTTQQLNVTGVTTLTSIVGTSLSITGISTIANFILSPVGTGATVGGIGVTYYGDGSNLTNVVSTSGYADNSGIATNVIGGIASVTSLDVSGISTLGTVKISSGIITSTTGGIVTYYGDGSKLDGVIASSSAVAIATNTTNQSQFLTYVTETGNVSGLGVTTTGLVFNPSTNSLGIGTTTPTSKLTVQGDVLVSGILTASRIVGTSLSISGISTIANFRMSPVGTGATVGGIGVTYYGDGSNLTGIVTSIVAGTNITISPSGTGQVTINSSSSGVASVTSLNVTGISTLGTVEISSGIITSTTGGIVTYYGDGSNLTGTIPNTIEDIESNQLYYPLLSPKLTGTISSISVSSTSLVFNPATNSLGIGTTNPVRLLHVLGYGITNGIRLGDLDFFNFGIGSAEAGSPTFRTGITNGDTILRVVPNGSGRSQFEFFGNDYFAPGISTEWVNVRINSVNNQTEFKIDTSQAQNKDVRPLVFEVGGNSNPSLPGLNPYQLYLSTEGKVGIGTSQPTSKLTVQGDVSIASTLGIGTVIDIVPYDTLNSGTLSWEGSAGQLLSITNNLTTGSIYSVNDVSGIPSIDVDANGTIQLGPYGGNIGLGTTNPTAKLHVIGDVRVSGASTFGGIVELDNSLRDINGNVGAAGSVLISTVSGVSWSAPASGGGSISIANTTTNAIHYVKFSPVSTGTTATLNVNTDRLQFNPSTGTLSATVFTSLSDRTQKEDIRPIENAIGIVNQLTGVRYNWKNNTNKPSIGLIAQDVEEVIPEVVVEMADGLKSVSYGNIVAVLIEAIKEQQVRIEELEDRLNA